MKELNERELLLLAYLEGELSGAKKAQAEAIMAEDMAMQHEYRQLQNTILKPETATVYPYKNKLKRTAAKEKTPLGYIIWPLAIAASFALLILVYTPNNNNAINNGNIAVINNKTENLANTNPTTSSANTIIATPPTQPKTNKQQITETPAHNIETTTPSTPNETTPENVTLNAPVLASLPIVLPTVSKPATKLATTAMPTLPAMPNYQKPEPEEKKGWWAKAGDKMNQLLSYVQKPQLSIEKQENETGKEYWTITLETEKYEVEGRLYTRR
jgi:Tfp pilus assembly protein PilE